LNLDMVALTWFSWRIRPSPGLSVQSPAIFLELI